MTSAATKATWAKCDALIDWYEKFRPTAGQRIAIDLDAVELWKCAHPNADPENKKYPREVYYRGRTRVATRR